MGLVFIVVEPHWYIVRHCYMPKSMEFFYFKFIFNLLYFKDHETIFYNELSLLKLNQIRQFHIVTTLYSVLLNDSPYLSERFSFLSITSVRITRQSSPLVVMSNHKLSIQYITGLLSCLFFDFGTVFQIMI